MTGSRYRTINAPCPNSAVRGRNCARRTCAAPPAGKQRRSLMPGHRARACAGGGCTSCGRLPPARAAIVSGGGDRGDAFGARGRRSRMVCRLGRGGDTGRTNRGPLSGQQTRSESLAERRSSEKWTAVKHAVWQGWAFTWEQWFFC
jgi:hypothetical protein